MDSTYYYIMAQMGLIDALMQRLVSPRNIPERSMSQYQKAKQGFQEIEKSFRNVGYDDYSEFQRLEIQLREISAIVYTLSTSSWMFYRDNPIIALGSGDILNFLYPNE